MLTPAPCTFYHIETYVIAQDLAKHIGWSASTLTLYNVTNMTEKLPHYLIHYRRFSRHREPVRSTGRHPHGRRLDIQPASTLNSSPAQKSPHTSSAPSLSLPPAALHATNGSTERQWQLSEKAVGRSEHGTETIMCSNAFRCVFCGVVRSGAVRCGAVHSPC